MDKAVKVFKKILAIGAIVLVVYDAVKALIPLVKPVIQSALDRCKKLWDEA